MILNKFKIIFISFLLLFLVISAVSAEDNDTIIKNPITHVIGGHTVSDENSASIKLYDENKNPISGGSSVHIQGKGFTISGSSISLSVSLPSDTATLTISNGVFQVNINKAKSSSGSIHADVNQNQKTFSILLKDSNGNPIKNKQVTISINGVSKNVNTDSNGEVLISISLPDNVDSVDISYNGHSKKTTADNSTASSNASSKVIPIDSKIKVSSKTFKVKKSKKLPVSLLDKNNKPIKNQKITIKINGKSYTVTTMSNGKATFNIKLNKKGTYNAKIIFKGDKNYKAISKTVKIKIK